jgi:hypothetical protein
MKLDVLNPVAKKVEKKAPSAPRLPKLDGKCIGLYWNHKSGGDAALRRTGELLKAHYPGVETKSYVGSIGGAIRHMTKDDVKLMALECAAVIGTTAD